MPSPTTWAAWREDPQRSERLVYVAIEKHPATREDIARVHAASDGARELPGLTAQLVAAWPLATPDVHALDFEDGRVQLRLALGDVNTLLRGLQLEADAIYLDGFAPTQCRHVDAGGLHAPGPARRARRHRSDLERRPGGA